MKFDIKGAWRYQDLMERHEKLQETKEALEEELHHQLKAFVSLESECALLGIERKRAKQDLEVEKKESARLRMELKELRDELEDKTKRLKAWMDKYKSTELDCCGWKHNCEISEKKLADARAENERLKKVRYRWVDSMHGWWPVEGADLNDMVQKIPYVVYTPKMEEKRVPEA